MNKSGLPLVFLRKVMPRKRALSRSSLDSKLDRMLKRHTGIDSESKIRSQKNSNRSEKKLSNQ